MPAFNFFNIRKYLRYDRKSWIDPKSHVRHKE